MIKQSIALLLATGSFADASAEVFYNTVWTETGAPFVGRTVDVGVADFNGDGRDDVWVVDPGGPSRVWISNASGVLEDSGQALGGGGTSAVALGDLDGDGDIDAVEAAAGSPSKIWINDGTGHFSSTDLTGDSGFSFGIALGDLDGDGDLDVALANAGGANTLWANNGSGGFTQLAQTLGSSQSNDLAWGDLDGDGDLDLVVANSGANTVWLNNAGTFSSGSVPATGNDSSSNTVALADFDGDGNLDAFFGEVNGNHVWRGDGAGGFTDTGLVLGAASSQDLVVRDFNGDGKPDVFVANDFSNGADKLWLNGSTPGTIAFTDSGIDFGVSYSTSAALGDFDGDGQHDDLFVGAGATTTQPDHIWLSQAPGVFVPGQVLLTAALSNAAVSYDFDGDDRNDVFVASTGANTVLLNSVGMQFHVAQRLGNDDSQGVALGDFNLDGEMDVAVANGNGGANRIWLNDGNGHFTDSGVVLGSGSSSQSLGIAANSLDGDECIDVVIANFGTPDQVWLNVDINPDPAVTECQFSAAPVLLDTGNNQSAAVQIADLDRDGDFDIFVTGIKSTVPPPGKIAVWLNDGSGSFTLGSTLNNPNGNVRKIALGLLDGDAVLDGFGVTSVNSYYWLGSDTVPGTFNDSVVVGQAVDGWDVAIDDVDFSGSNDVFIVSDSGANKVLYNDGNANFTDSGISLPAVKGRGIVLDDFDGDGDPDAFIAANGLNMALRNDPFAGGSQGFDVDGNGRVDALTDGIIIIRYIFGIRGAALLQDAIAPDATADGATIEAHMAGLSPSLDADGNGAVDALSDGIVIIRYMFGFRGDPLVQGALAPDATRTTAAQVEAWAAGIGL